MPRIAAIGIGSMALLIASACLGAAHEPRRVSSGTDQLDWLAGCWERRSGETTIEEQWMRPRGGVMLGMSRTTRRDTVIEFEHLRIFDRAGRTVYAAMPSGQPSAEFETAAMSDSMAVSYTHLTLPTTPYV